MERLTIEKPVSEMGAYELAHNCCYIQNGVARYRDYNKDVDARALARHLMVYNGFWNDCGDSPITDKERVDNEIFDETMIEQLAFGEEDLEGLIAIFYRLIWAMADLREALKEYEDTGLSQPDHNGWIPCNERLPGEPFGCLVTIIDVNPVTLEDFENVLPYHVGYDGGSWNDSDGEQIPFEVIAWQPLPEPYKE